MIDFWCNKNDHVEGDRSDCQPLTTTIAHDFYNTIHLYGDIIILLTFIFSSLHGYQVMLCLSTNKQRHHLLLLKTGIHFAPTHL